MKCVKCGKAEGTKVVYLHVAVCLKCFKQWLKIFNSILLPFKLKLEKDNVLKGHDRVDALTEKWYFEFHKFCGKLKEKVIFS